MTQFTQLLLYKVAVGLHPPQTLFELQKVHPAIEHVKQVSAFWLYVIPTGQEQVLPSTINRDLQLTQILAVLH